MRIQIHAAIFQCCIPNFVVVGCWLLFLLGLLFLLAGCWFWTFCVFFLRRGSAKMIASTVNVSGSKHMQKEACNCPRVNRTTRRPAGTPSVTPHSAVLATVFDSNWAEPLGKIVNVCIYCKLQLSPGDSDDATERTIDRRDFSPRRRRAHFHESERFEWAPHAACTGRCMFRMKTPIVTT